MPNYILIERIELNSSATSVTFANIPQSGYTDLKVDFSIRTDKSAANENVFLSFNGSTANFSARWFYGGGTGGVGSSTTGRIAGFGNGNTATSNTFGSSTIYIPNYTSSSNKSYSGDAVLEDNNNVAYDGLIAGLWSNTAAITSITLTPETGPNFLQYSTFSLYGLAATDTTPTLAPQATGGNIITTDGTYWYHAFLTSGTFTPLSSLTSDILVVAGGGGGGGSGPGGGAGGLLTFTSQSVTATGYTCTIGAGGAAGYTATQAGFRGSTGSDSQFGALTLVKGGGGAGGNDNSGQQNGLSGGSGGGSGSFGATVGTGGSATSGQGNAGGSGATDNNTYRTVGGGGGAGAAGGNGTSGANGAGGVGATSALITAMGNATNTGQLVSSSRYFAGGSGYTTAGYGGGGTVSVAGTANTGGGGGGSYFTSGSTPVYGGAGGSGIVIVRYAV